MFSIASGVPGSGGKVMTLRIKIRTLSLGAVRLSLSHKGRGEKLLT
jgi:hypothetical protein